MLKAIGDPRSFALVLITIGFAIQQITVGHNLDTNTAMTLLVGGLGAGGVSVAHAAGINAATAAATARGVESPPAETPANPPAP